MQLETLRILVSEKEDKAALTHQFPFCIDWLLWTSGFCLHAAGWPWPSEKAQQRDSTKSFSVWYWTWWGLPWWFSKKESAYNAEDADVGSIPGLRRSTGRGSGNPAQYFTWKNRWVEDTGGLQSMGWQRVGRSWATEHWKIIPRIFHHRCTKSNRLEGYSWCYHECLTHNFLYSAVLFGQHKIAILRGLTILIGIQSM